jgi:iron complex outermembrane recepter protein
MNYQKTYFVLGIALSTVWLAASPLTRAASPAQPAADAAPATADQAQDAPLEEITVSSRFIETSGRSALKMDVPVRDVPFTMTDYSQAFMKAVDTSKVTDLYGYMSGVQRAGVSGYDISIRGFTMSSTDPNSVLVDGLPGLAARVSSPETADLERVEVVKGPSSVLYGRAQPGGFLNLITKKPQAKPQTSVEVRASTFDGDGIAFGDKLGYLGSVDSTGPINEQGSFLYRGIVQFEKSQSFRDFVHGNSLLLAPSLTWNYLPGSSATLLLEYRHSKGRYDQGLVAPNLDYTRIARDTTRYQEPTDSQEETGETGTLIVHHEFSQQVSWNTSVRSVNANDHSIGFDSDAILGNFVTLRRRDRNQNNFHHYNYLDTSLTSKFDTGPIGHQLLTGATVGRTIEDYNRLRFFTTPALNISIYNPVYGDVAPAVEPPQSHSWASVMSYGAYANDLVTLSEHWKVVAGVRYDREDEANRELRLPTPVGTKKATFSNTYPMGGLMFQPTQQWTVYASYSTSYVPPPAGVQPFDPTVTLKAQTADQKEAGVKYEAADGKANATLSVFDIQENNVIQVVGTTGLYEQVGKQRGRGVETELNVRPTDKWQLDGNYSFIDAKITDDVVANRIGSPTQNSARHSASLLSRFSFSGALQDFGASVGAVYRSQRRGTLPTATQSRALVLPGYTVVDTSLYYMHGTFSASLKMANVLDKRYYQSAFADIRIQPGEPRRFLLTLDKTF